MLAYDIKQVGPHTYTIHDKETGEQVNIVERMTMESEPTGVSASPGKRSGVPDATDRDRLSPPCPGSLD